MEADRDSRRRRRVASCAAALALTLGAGPAAAAVTPSTFQARLAAPVGTETGAGALASSVAVSDDGNTALAGAPADDGQKGAVWVFTRSAGAWSEQAVLKAPPTGGSAAVGAATFGRDVALSADGNTALIGGDSDSGAAGAAWVYVRSGSAWTPQAKLQAPASGPDQEDDPARLGYSVALSADGNTAALGGPLNNTSGFVDQGAVWVFTRGGTTWAEQAKLKPANTSFAPQFGFSVALSDDGNQLLGGGPFQGMEQGAVWAFSRTGATWSAPAPPIAPSTVGPFASTDNSTYFGASVALDGAGTTALVGGPRDGATNDVGATWVLTRSGGTWSLAAKLTAAAGTETAGQFGYDVALDGPGTTGLIGGAFDSASAGAAWLFTGSGATWTQGPKLTAPAGTETGGGVFGAATALSQEAQTALIGGPGDSSAAGAAWAFVSPPVVSNVAPPSGPASGGTTVTITGSALNGVTGVSFGGTPAASFTAVSQTQVQAVSPPGDAAPVDVTVMTQAGTSATGLEDRFTYFASAPGAPGGVHATAGNRQATVSFAAPPANGSAITQYTVTAAPGGATATGPGSPITVGGLTNGTSYTFTVKAANGVGTGPPSAPSNAVTPSAPPPPPLARPKITRVSLKGVARRKPALAFTLTAAATAPRAKSVAITLPKGLSFARSAHTRARGLTVRGANGKRAKFTNRLSGGVLTLTFSGATRRASVRVATPALVATRALARRVERRLAGRLTLVFTVTDVKRKRTRLTAKVRPS